MPSDLSDILWMRRRRGGGSSPSYDPDALALFAAMSVEPDNTRKALTNSTIVALKSAGIWEDLDLLYCLAAHDAQAARLNWRNPSTYTCALVNAPAYTVDRGYQGDGSTSYLNTQWQPGTHGVRYADYDASLWVWSRTDAQVDGCDIGTRSTSPNSRESSIFTKHSSGALLMRINQGNIGGATTDMANSMGLYGAQRVDDSSTIYRWKDGAAVAPATGSNHAFTGRPTANLGVCARIGALSYSPRQIAFAAAGASLAGKEAAFYSIINDYMTAVGAA